MQGPWMFVWALLAIAVALVPEGEASSLACRSEHLFCRDEETGGLRTNKAKVIISPNVGSTVTDFEGPLRVMSGHHVIFDGILHTAATIRVTGDVIVAGGAEISLHEVVVVSTGSVQLRDDSRMYMTLNSYIGYASCAELGRDVALQVEASLYDPALRHPIVALRQAVSGDGDGSSDGGNRSGDACLDGTFASVEVVDISDANGSSTSADGDNCASRAGSLAAIFGTATCPSPPPPAHHPPSPPPPAYVDLSPPDDAPEPTGTPPGPVQTTPPAPRDVEHNAADSESSDSSLAWIIVGVMGAVLLLCAVLLAVVYQVPSMRARFFPHRDHEYNSEAYTTRDQGDTEMHSIRSDDDRSPPLARSPYMDGSISE